MGFVAHVAVACMSSQILSIQSSVVHGYVGGESAVFPLQLLGFEVDPIDAPGWSFLSRGAVLVMLGECPDEVDARETGNHSWFLHVMTEGVDALHEEFVSRGAKVVVPLGNRPHGHRASS